MLRFLLLFAAMVFALPPVSARSGPAFQGAGYHEGPVKGRLVDCGFPLGDSNYHAIIQASDGKVYYAISTHQSYNTVNLFRYDPKTGAAAKIADLGDVLGEDRTKYLAQGKIHCDFYESGGKLFFGTHAGVYARGGTKDRGPYPGGHFMSYDLKTGKFEDYGIGAPEEGMVAVNMDSLRGRLYTVTHPSGLFIYYDLRTGKMKVFDPPVKGGNCRSLAVDPRDGNVYWYNLDESVNRYDYARDTVEKLPDVSLRRPVLAVHSRTSKDDRVWWRSIRWCAPMQRFIGITFYGEHLFSWEPRTGEIEILDRLAAGPNRRSGDIEHSQLGFELSPDGTRVYYLALQALPPERPEGKTRYELHLVTYDLSVRRYIDHGPLELADGRRPTFCEGLEPGRDGNIYAVCWVPLRDLNGEKSHRIIAARYSTATPEELKDAYEMNLVVIPNPLKKIRSSSKR